ncbi:hypothetical protein HPSA50_1549 [Helicobacter pylori SouthAfrica50]|uniref:Uncharacterized protein n=1 Tax=Helicobacter pylori SouthAfrica50 TaxID=1352357 RepID=T2SAB5_HELPX|nr:hypothetical protein HPSA50_1549 [Helicobacter pylori SouthAfrica50]
MILILNYAHYKNNQPSGFLIIIKDLKKAIKIDSLKKRFLLKLRSP